MSELRTREVEDLLNVLAGLNEPDDIFALLEDLFTIREIKDTSQRLEVARLLREGESYCFDREDNGSFGNHYRARLESAQLWHGWLSAGT